MGRAAKTQWEFGDLFEARPEKQVLTVGELTQRVKSVLEGQVGAVWVTGELSNLRAQSSGHMYFTLKDAASQLACVLFRGTGARHREALADGVKVILQGDVTVYEPRGQYQLVVRQVELQGVGALQLAFERLKQKLQAEGLFAPERKRALPRCPQRVGVVTSATGAALRDVLHVIRRRNPGLEVVLAPSRVQGEGAAAEIVAAIQLLNEWSAARPKSGGLDLILVTRGGGSLEDLWCFNEEAVARAVAASALPVVSGVGHEIDFTMCDFAADLRAATPSAAAELITEGVFASRQFVAEARQVLRELVRDRMTEVREQLLGCVRRLGLVHPRRRLDMQAQRLDELEAALRRELALRFALRRGDWERLWGRWRALNPVERLRHKFQGVEALHRRNRERVRSRMEALRAALGKAEAELRLLSPLSVLDRGYSITLDPATGTVVRDAARVRRGQRLLTRLRRGQVESVVDAGEFREPGTGAAG